MSEVNKCCDTKGAIKSVILIKASDVKTWNPLKLKRKYGKHKRTVKEYSL